MVSADVNKKQQRKATTTTTPMKKREITRITGGRWSFKKDGSQQGVMIFVEGDNIELQKSPSAEHEPHYDTKQGQQLLTKETNHSSSSTSTSTSTSTISDTNNPALVNNNNINLVEQCPEATDAEITRFLTARKGDKKAALEQLESHLKWRKEHGIMNVADVSNRKDIDIWNDAAKAALSFYYDADKVAQVKLPRLAFFDADNGSTKEMRDKAGRRILQVLPAQIDVSIASEETYALCLALYLDQHAPRDSTEKVTVAVDVRGGEGWANAPAGNFIQFIKKLAAILERNYPERLAKLIVFPLPFYATYLWKMVKLFLDPDTAKKIAIVGGPAGIEDKYPTKLDKYIEPVNLQRLEENRLGSFC